MANTPALLSRPPQMDPVDELGAKLAWRREFEVRIESRAAPSAAMTACTDARGARAVAIARRVAVRYCVANVEAAERG
jgi:hypothetical protein